ncbi:MAG: hypothetical protein KF861_05900 [Planctomycetaceae bacterium]|nr:hypothetical protein [Planctomycetaceae bacterium]
MRPAVPNHHRRLPAILREPLWRAAASGCLIATAFGWGCHSGESPPPTNAAESRNLDDEPRTPTAPAQRVSDEPGVITIAQLRDRLGIGDAGQIQKVGGQIVAIDLRGTGVKDISALAGLPLRELYLESNPLSDITALKGMPLDKLYLDDTQVADLTPLAGMKLTELNLSRTPVADLTPLKEVEFGTLWIPETKVSDLSPLAGKAFISLDVRATPVGDLSPLAGNAALRRLHIGETHVEDVSPLAGLTLERLILSPDRIRAGMDVLRTMASLKGLDTEFDGVSQVKTPEEFWNVYDAGELSDPGRSAQ